MQGVFSKGSLFGLDSVHQRHTMSEGVNVDSEPKRLVVAGHEDRAYMRKEIGRYRKWEAIKDF